MLVAAKLVLARYGTSYGSSLRAAVMRRVRLGIGSASLMTLVTVGAAGVLAGPEATPASATAAATPTQIVDFAASPSVVSYPSPQMTVSGVLETTGSPPQPLAKTWSACRSRRAPTLRGPACGLTPPGTSECRLRRWGRLRSKRGISVTRNNGRRPPRPP